MHLIPHGWIFQVYSHVRGKFALLVFLSKQQLVHWLDERSHLFFSFSFSSSPSPRMSTGDVFGATTRSNIRRSHRRFAFLFFFFFFFSLLSIREIKTIIRKMVSSVERLRGDRRFSWINNRENSFEQIRIFSF